jgi:hypothetical protein
LPTPSNPPGVLLNISEGKNEGEEGEWEGWRVLICRDFGMGSWERDWNVDRAVRGSGEVDGAERGVGGAWLFVSLIFETRMVGSRDDAWNISNAI